MASRQQTDSNALQLYVELESNLIGCICTILQCLVQCSTVLILFAGICYLQGISPRWDALGTLLWFQTTTSYKSSATTQSPQNAVAEKLPSYRVGEVTFYRFSMQHDRYLEVDTVQWHLSLVSGLHRDI